MANEEMWNKLFERVDSLKAELKPTETDVRDALVLAAYGLSLSFLFNAIDHPSGARRLKDNIVEGMKKNGLSPNRIQITTDTLTSLCDVAEMGKYS